MFLLIPQPVEEWIIMVSFYCWPKMVIEEFGPQEMRPYMHVKLYYNIYIYIIQFNTRIYIYICRVQYKTIIYIYIHMYMYNPI